MSEITQITDYEARLVALLPSQFRTQPNWLSLIAALAGAGKLFQRQEDAVYALWQQRASLDDAEGAQLAQWGKLFGLPNQGWDDDSYRARLRVWLQVVRSTATPDELLRILSGISDVALGSGVKYWAHPPASYSMQVTTDLWSTDPERAKDAARYVAEADPAGTGIGQIIIAPVTSPFLFGSSGANGFSSATTTRGRFCVDAATVAGV